MKIGDGSYDFAKVIRMIDDMIVLLGKERADNDEEKDFCEADLDTAEDKLKELKHTIANLEKDIADGGANFATLTDEAQLVQSSKDLDKDVAEATEQRNEENEEFTETIAADSAAEEPLQSAKNWLNIFAMNML